MPADGGLGEVETAFPGGPVDADGATGTGDCGRFVAQVLGGDEVPVAVVDGFQDALNFLDFGFSECDLGFAEFEVDAYFVVGGGVIGII